MPVREPTGDRKSTLGRDSRRREDEEMRMGASQTGCGCRVPGMAGWEIGCATQDFWHSGMIRIHNRLLRKRSLAVRSLPVSADKMRLVSVGENPWPAPNRSTYLTMLNAK